MLPASCFPMLSAPSTRICQMPIKQMPDTERYTLFVRYRPRPWSARMPVRSSWEAPWRYSWRRG
jgi:hypothetical protein